MAVGSLVPDTEGLGALEFPDEGLKGGIAGRALGLMVEEKPLGVSSPTRAEGVEGLLALAGGLPVGVEGGALFLPFLGGIVDIRVGEYENLSVSDWLRVTSQIGR